MGSSWTRARTHVPCIGRRILNHCATSEVPPFLLFVVLSRMLFSFAYFCVYMCVCIYIYIYIYIYTHTNTHIYGISLWLDCFHSTLRFWVSSLLTYVALLFVFHCMNMGGCTMVYSSMVLFMDIWVVSNLFLLLWTLFLGHSYPCLVELMRKSFSRVYA